MYNKGSGQGLGLIFLLSLTLLVTSYGLLVTDLFAEEESYTITTYYPSPYGSYNELQVYRSVRYMPINKDTLADRKEGELVYNSSDDKLYLYNGSSWVAQGGGGNLFSLKCRWLYIAGVNYAGVNCIPPTCPSGWTDLGTGCADSGVSSFNNGNWWYYYESGYCERWCYKE